MGARYGERVAPCRYELSLLLKAEGIGCFENEDLQRPKMDHRVS
jgi:hypothetical protein